jgi:inactivated superfamily I helicase/RecB family exonuclease
MTDALRFTEGTPRVYAIAPGMPVAEALAAGLRARLGSDPLALARVSLLLDTRRAGREVVEALETGTAASFLPRILALGDAGTNLPGATLALKDMAPAVPPLRRWLTLTRLVAQWLAHRPERAPEAAAPALAQALASLLDTVQRAGRDLAALAATVPEDHARHWDDTQAFLAILAEAWPAILAESEGGALDPEARRRGAVEALLAVWAAGTDPGPIVAAGSPGAAETSAMLMAGIARLPQGAVVLPGFDPAIAAEIWARIGPEHPYAGFRDLLRRLDMTPDAVTLWHDTAAQPASTARRFLIGQALRPAPVTDRWLDAQPRLTAEAAEATAGLTLIEAPDPRREATAIALVLRGALEMPGRRAALITPDRDLARRVAAALRRWGIEADDSAGRPLSLTPPGVLLRLLAEAAFGPFDPVSLLALLKHPLAGAGTARGPYLGAVRLLEMTALRGRPTVTDLDTARAALAAARGDAAPALAALDAVIGLRASASGTLADMAAAHRAAAENLCGPALWEKETGEAAARLTTRFAEAADLYGPCTPEAYPALFATAMAGETVTVAAYRPDPRIAIWGTLEARMQRADLLVMGGLNEGAWPAQPPPDPWLSRQMREKADLPAPEALIGLDALDFQQAACGPEVVLTRSLKAGGAPTTPSRWLARLATLLGGTAPEALAAMQARGAEWLSLVDPLERPAASVESAPRPCPAPPVAARPNRLSATAVETLIRDPYAIYARTVLNLAPLPPLGIEVDARLRGEVLHAALERFCRDTADAWPADPAAALDAAACAVLDAAPLPVTTRRLWRARMARLAPTFLRDEAQRRETGRPAAFEAKGERTENGFTLRARADRIDRRQDGRLALYDYKTGHIPTKKEVAVFAKQMPLMAAIAEAGGFEGMAAAPVATLAHISLSGGREGGRTVPLDGDPSAMAAETWTRLLGLIERFRDPATGYLARARPQQLRYASDYDHLSRLGEWEDGGDD